MLIRSPNQERMNLAATIWRKGAALHRAARVSLGSTPVYRGLTGLKVTAAPTGGELRSRRASESAGCKKQILVSNNQKGRTYMRSTRNHCKNWQVWLLGALFAGMTWGAFAQSTNDPVSVNRLIIQFRAGPTNIFQLVSKTSIMKILSPSDQVPLVGRPVSGFWFELQDSIGGVRYRRVIDNPIRPAGSTGPAPAEQVFSLFVPSPVNGDRLVLFSSPLIPGGESQAAQEVGRVAL